MVSAEPSLLYLWSIFIPKLAAAMSFLLQRRLTSCPLQDKWRKKNKQNHFPQRAASAFFSFPVISLQHEKKLSLFSEKSHHSQLISKESLAADVGYPGGCSRLPGSIPVSRVGFRVCTLRDGCRRARSALFQQASCFVGPRATYPLM